MRRAAGHAQGTAAAPTAAAGALHAFTTNPDTARPVTAPESQTRQQTRGRENKQWSRQ